MHLGLDLLFISGRAGGVETYVRELVPAMRRARPDLRMTAFVPKGHQAVPWLEGVELVPAGLPGPKRAAMLGAQSSRLPVLAGRHGVDLLHSPANFAPLLSSVPLVVTVHDLLHRREPSLVGLLHRPVVRAFVDGAARRARRIITVSEASAADIVEFVGRRRADIDVTPLAAGPVRPLDPSERRVPARPQLLSVGSRKPHKNLGVLLGALALIEPARRPTLVMPGEGLEEDLRGRVSSLGLESDVVMPGWVSDEELEQLYASTTAYLCPSLFEGFGLPVLEAMQRGVPVACADIPVLREVAADAAEYFDPRSERSVADAISSLTTDVTRAASLVHRGRARASSFSWDRTAELTLESYDRVLAAGPGAGG